MPFDSLGSSPIFWDQMDFFQKLLAFGDVGLFVLRVAVATVFLVHGWPKLKNPGHMAQGMKWPNAAVTVLGLVECVGALCVLSGLYLQIGALAMCVVMLGAMYHKIFSWKTPFYAQGKNGWELDALLFAAALMLATNGGGSIVL